ncbi:hypothetical protein DFJ74DRAFT_430401 [Hyaloraphidium curvatum]|nr:hypothetical protein DFJ74DRAFT_430401 [Hyaloraphidium curvatum]
MTAASFAGSKPIAAASSLLIALRRGDLVELELGVQMGELGPAPDVIQVRAGRQPLAALAAAAVHDRPVHAGDHLAAAPRAREQAHVLDDRVQDAALARAEVGDQVVPPLLLSSLPPPPSFPGARSPFVAHQEHKHPSGSARLTRRGHPFRPHRGGASRPQSFENPRKQTYEHVAASLQAVLCEPRRRSRVDRKDPHVLGLAARRRPADQNTSDGEDRLAEARHGELVRHSDGAVERAGAGNAVGEGRHVQPPHLRDPGQRVGEARGGDLARHERVGCDRFPRRS